MSSVGLPGTTRRSAVWLGRRRPVWGRFRAVAAWEVAVVKAAVGVMPPWTNAMTASGRTPWGLPGLILGV